MNINMNIVLETIFGKESDATIETEKFIYAAEHQKREIIRLPYTHDYGNYIHTWAILKVHTEDEHLHVRVAFLSKPREMCRRFLDCIRYGTLGNRLNTFTHESEGNNTWHCEIELGNPDCFEHVLEIDKQLQKFKLLWLQT
jgi:hypothetical protein